MTSPYLVSAQERMSQEDAARETLRAIRQSALYQPLPEKPVRHRERLISPAGWAMLGILGFWTVVALIAWVV